MKKVFFIIPAAACCLCMSCNSGNNGSTASVATQTVDSTAIKNMASDNAIDKAIMSGDVSNLGDYIAADAVDHQGGEGDIKGLDSIKAALAKQHVYSNDMKMDVIKEVADSEYVFEWSHITGTNTAPGMGPVGSKFDIHTVEVTRYQNGKAEEHWEFMQPAELMKMMQEDKDAKAHKK